MWAKKSIVLPGFERVAHSLGWRKHWYGRTALEKAGDSQWRLWTQGTMLGDWTSNCTSFNRPAGPGAVLGLHSPQGSQEEPRPAWPSAAACGDRASLQVTFCRRVESCRASLTCVHWQKHTFLLKTEKHVSTKCCKTQHNRSAIHTDDPEPRRTLARSANWTLSPLRRSGWKSEFVRRPSEKRWTGSRCACMLL